MRGNEDERGASRGGTVREGKGREKEFQTQAGKNKRGAGRAGSTGSDREREGERVLQRVGVGG